MASLDSSLVGIDGVVRLWRSRIRQKIDGIVLYVTRRVKNCAIVVARSVLCANSVIEVLRRALVFVNALWMMASIIGDDSTATNIINSVLFRVLLLH